jgi:hypothetical protein
VPPLLIFLAEKFANINPVISGWSFSLRKKVSCKHMMSGICFCNIDTLLEVSAIDIKLNNKLTTIVYIYDTDSKTTQSEYQKIFTQISDQYVSLAFHCKTLNMA